ncbi:MAG: metallophosphoesterase [Anaerolineae bacterium]|nr:metallophosphoesterase [Anaerolineae bacterium]
MGHGVSRRKFLKLAAGSIASVGLSGIAGSAYATQIEPNAVALTRLTFTLPHLSSAFNGLTIAQISDFHLGGWMSREHMATIAQQVNALNPDVIAITGDFVEREVDAGLADTLLQSLQQFTAREAILGILGNHDHWSYAPRVIRNINAAKNVHLLVNESTVIQRGTDRLFIAGVDDVWEKKNDLTSALKQIPDQAPVILMAHEPDYADEVARTGRVGLQLSGHTHGGQVRVPGVGALILPHLGRQYQTGLYTVNGMALYVNRGLGMIRPYVRLNCSPEVTLITLKSPTV